MKICYFVYIWMFLTEIKVSSTDGIEIHGYSGKYVIISCYYMGASNKVKYFCRDPCKNKKEDILVSSDRSPTGRFRLEDTNTGTFTVTITDLQESDSGIYWCGVDRTLIDSYNRVNLRVYKDATRPISTSAPQPESPFATSSRTSRYSNPDDITTSVTELYQSNLSISLHAIGGLILVIVLLCLLVAVYQYRKRVRKPASNKPIRHNERRAEEADNVRDNDLQDLQNNKQIKSKKLKLEVPKSNELLVYQNLLVKTGQSEVIYETMNSVQLL
ncbi:uncharacterized protein [Misgurnus anguillicaudatus]|uniref:uncharacterized protein n=1 Tax=Misgurnus anguillicaudatus TaxID=75329 RepID=UPI00243566B9|nr:CMRF35-like molecule 3 [Misgurnus anguillicaudatus]